MGRSQNRLLVWSDEYAAAFTAVKSSLAEATMLANPKSDAPLCIMVAASDVAVGGVFQHHVEGKCEPISFFSKRLQPPETRYSTFIHELLVVYLVIHNFCHVLEGVLCLH